MAERSRSVDGRGGACAVDVAVVGGGPAGLAVAIAAAREGLRVRVLERRAGVPDKACGEGLLPPALRALDRLGVRALLEVDDCAPIDGVRWIQEDGMCAEARLPRGGGLGVRRLALERALQRRATAVGVALRDGCAVHEVALASGGALARLETDEGPLEARVVIAADGLASPIRRAAGLERHPRARARRRFGVRQHFRLRPWSRFVEVHFADGVEAYVTPAGRERVGVAFLFEASVSSSSPVSFAQLLLRFPALARQLGGAAIGSRARGAGPLARAASAVIADRLVLVGDAAGYLDAISGEGLSLAFACAEALGPILGAAVPAGATRRSLVPYANEHRRLYRRYEWITRALLAVARRPPLRRQVLARLAAHPSLFSRVLGWAVDPDAGELPTVAGSTVAPIPSE